MEAARKQVALREALLITGDILVVGLAAYLALTVVATFGLGALMPHGRHLIAFALVFLYLAAIYYEDLYAKERPLERREIVLGVLRAAGKLSILLGLMLVAAPHLDSPKGFCAVYIGVASVGLVSWRLTMGYVMASRSVARIAVVGTGERGLLVADQIVRRRHLGYEFLGFIEYAERIEGAASSHQFGGHQVNVVSTLDEIMPRLNVTGIVIADDEASRFPVRELLQWRTRGIEIVDFDPFYEQLTGKLAVPLVRAQWLVFAPGFNRSALRDYVKRVTDLTTAALIALVAWPVALLTAIAIKLESPGPILYWQRRVGMNGRVFTIYKFRSMRQGAENETGPVWASVDDPRLTRVGRIIRRLRIDELPQLVNVLYGEMSLVGPRPERPEIVGELSGELPLYDYRHTVKPGLTGWAQICYPYGASLEDALEKLRYDLYYIKNLSPLFDLRILLRTIKVVLFGRGAR